MFFDLIEKIASIIVNLVYIISFYYLAISILGLLLKNRKNKKLDKKNRFAIVIAAHDEEKVISNSLKSLKGLNYDKEFYDVFVVADNCTDKTKEYSLAQGALVYERFDDNNKGKGYALEWMFNKIFDMGDRYSAIIVLDADNIVSPNFLTEMNTKLNNGYKVIQGYIDSKNPNDNWLTMSYSIAFWSNNRLFQLCRDNLGLSCQLSGTGFCLDIETLKKVGWGATCLTEDLEFTCKLIMNNMRVVFAYKAVVYDEKPLTLKQSWNQRKRWMQGFADVSSRYFLKLIERVFSHRDLKALDCALYSIQPIVITILGIVSIFNMSRLLLSLVGIFMGQPLVFEFKAIRFISLAYFIFQFMITPIMIHLDSKLNFKVLMYYIFIYPFYIITWVPIAIQGILNKNKKEWFHTDHSRNVSINELEKFKN
ncbi:glycosyltransferase family 2 protein [Candidatus Arthromitus sp. SFB-rat-Yit]|uniref:glycosyltransferase family 2 protein n=1 Tax=Candidatus Arthromitus sp. SFB-rat-Yit TaxID=1041504 RepID=UPI000227A0DB|nr:glycosyltransferase family 2 protein [Candidatus Arthromitus sp. SFB-rat-Yit]BAK81250.1 glycosyltransferase [Candidatus Arthromitus sp. SFB-rat-Yit]